MKLRVLTLAVVALSFPFQGQSGNACTPLFVLLDDAKHQSPLLKAAQSNMERADSNVELSKSAWRPQLSLFGRTAVGDSQFSQTQTDNSVGLRASQRLYDFGRAKLNVQATQFEKAEAEARYRVASDDEALRISLAYVDMLEFSESLKTLRQRAAYLKDHMQVLGDMLKESAATISQVAEAKAEWAATSADIATLSHQLTNAKLEITSRVSAFDGVCNIDSIDQWTKNKNSLGPDKPLGWESKIVAVSPLYLAEMARFDGLKTREKIEKKSRLPNIEIVGTSTYGYDNSVDRWGNRNQLGIEVSVPLISGGMVGAQQKIATFDAARANFQALEIAQRLKQNIKVTQSKVSALENEKVARMLAMEAAHDQFLAASLEYTAGARSFTNLVEVRSKRDQAVLIDIQVRFELSRQRLVLTNLVYGLNEK